MLLGFVPCSSFVEGGGDRVIAIRMYGLPTVADTTWNGTPYGPDVHTTVNPVSQSEYAGRGGTITLACPQRGLPREPRCRGRAPGTLSSEIRKTKPPGRSASGASCAHAGCAPGVTRTPGQRFRKPLLYPPELQGQVVVATLLQCFHLMLR